MGGGIIGCGGLLSLAGLQRVKTEEAEDAKGLQLMETQLPLTAA